MPNLLRFFLFCLLAAIAGAAWAEAGTACPPVAVQPTPEAVQAGMRNARDHGFLWRISRDGRTSYLYGTLHVAKPEWMYPGPEVMQALREADTVALELDMLNPDIRGRLAAGMAALPNAPLPEHLTKRLRKQADAVCVPYETLAALTPELQIVTLTVMTARWEGLDASYGIDSVLAGIGHGAKKNVVSLETPEAQLKMLEMEDAQESIATVQDGLAELETGGARKLLKRIAQVWASADYAAMARYGEWCDCLNTQTEREMMKRMLDDRNPGLAAGIDDIHADGKQVFAAVGSLHMFGPFGLPALMAKRGYRVERVDLHPR
ncbi:MAG: TraB/GumN family protein [Sideroxyarcus sp.]|nr:TraB/GumN family protein [Sideroxyarcus sp.]